MGTNRLTANCEHDRLKQEGYSNCEHCGEEFGTPIARNSLFLGARRAKVFWVPVSILLASLTSPLLRRGKFIDAITIESLLPHPPHRPSRRSSLV